MAEKHLHELLREDQEPFLLKNYIADRRCLLKRPPSKSHLQIKKRKPISQGSNFCKNFCKNACIFSFNSPDPVKSPLFEFHSPAKSPCKSPSAIFLHIPTRTAALLLEAALRIQKQSSKPQNKSNRFGIFGSILKRLKNRSKTPKHEISGDGVKLSVKDILRWDPHIGSKKFPSQRAGRQLNGSIVCDQTSSLGMGTSYLGKARPSSAVWVESNEGKSLDLEFDTPSCSSQFDDSDGADDFVENVDKHFCESPFHFMLQRSPSPGRRTPDFPSRATFPNRHGLEAIENNDVERSKKFPAQEQREEGEEVDEEQCSPVSVLDPTFVDDSDGHEDQGEEDSYDLHCSYAIVPRAKQQLLRKLCRLEKLAELDPFELEKRSPKLEQEVEEENNSIHDPEEDKECGDNELVSCNGEKDIRGIIIEKLSNSSLFSVKKIPSDGKRLVSDIIEEESKDKFADGEAAMVKRVCKRFESWEDMQSNTIDMMVEQDFNELDGWKGGNQEQVGEAGTEIEFVIFGLLLEELTKELVWLRGIQSGNSQF